MELATKSQLLRIPALLAALSHVALAGCVRYHARPLSPAGTAQAFGSRTLDNPALREFIEASNGRRSGTWPLPSWGLDDLTLAAFYYHPDLDLARAQWALATAATRSAGERPNPELNLTPGYNTTTRTPTPWIPLGLLNIPLETSGKRGHRVEQARHLAEAARLNVASIAWQVRSRVRSSLVAFQAARDTDHGKCDRVVPSSYPS